MPQVTLYSSLLCPYCFAAKRLLKQFNLNYREIRVDTNSQKKQEMITRSGRFTVPQIFIDDTHVGGYTDLMDFQNSGRLQQILES